MHRYAPINLKTTYDLQITHYLPKLPLWNQALTAWTTVEQTTSTQAMLCPH